MDEIWKTIKNTNNKYFISNYGRYKTIDRNVKNRHNEKRFIKGMIRKIFIRKDGYCLAKFYLNGKRWSKYIHHLVWEYFGNGIKSNHKIVLDHIDNNKVNNRIDNLRLITNRENIIKGKLLKPNGCQ